MTMFITILILFCILTTGYILYQKSKDRKFLNLLLSRFDELNIEKNKPYRGYYLEINSLPYKGHALIELKGQNPYTCEPFEQKYTISSSDKLDVAVREIKQFLDKQMVAYNKAYQSNYSFLDLEKRDYKYFWFTQDIQYLLDSLAIIINDSELKVIHNKNKQVMEALQFYDEFILNLILTNHFPLDHYIIIKPKYNLPQRVEIITVIEKIHEMFDEIKHRCTEKFPELDSISMTNFMIRYNK